MNGFEATRRILELRPETVVVLVSAWAEESLAGGARALRRGGDAAQATISSRRCSASSGRGTATAFAA